jgi:hypothetical protein
MCNERGEGERFEKTMNLRGERGIESRTRGKVEKRKERKN